MRTVDRVHMAVDPDTAFAAAADVTAWPARLQHYRWVRRLEQRPDGSALVEMAAWRPFGVARWPTWWVSEMWTDAEARTVRYRHVRGITTGMDVEWRIVAAGSGSDVSIVHEWNGPRWPLVGSLVASAVIGPVFIHGIASRTLAGLAAWTARQATVRSTPN